MPTIVLRHITQRYGAGDSAAPPVRVLPTSVAQTTLSPRSMPEPIDRPNALDDLSLTIRNGEVLGVLGPSGCGKTTLLKVIAGLIKPDTGDVLYDGTPVAETPMSERGIGMVFQNYALYPHMEARENIGFYDLIRKQPERIPERIQHIVEVMGVELEHLLSRKPPTLSGGEQQRVAVARCLARDPQLFLFDEPLSNLDAKVRGATRVQLKRLLQHYKITAVYVTHDQTEAIALADRIAIMRAGKIEQVGTARALYNTPLNAFVAQFFGIPPMNLFLGYVFNDAWEGRSFTIPSIRPALKQGQALWLGIRPEHIEITADGIPARIEHIEPILTQRQQLLYMTIAGQSCVVSAPLDQQYSRNDTLHLALPKEHLYLFDKNTGVRVG